MTERKFEVERKVKDRGSREHALRCHAPLGEVEGGTRGLALTRPALSAGEHRAGVGGQHGTRMVPACRTVSAPLGIKC